MLFSFNDEVHAALFFRVVADSAGSLQVCSHLSQD